MKNKYVILAIFFCLSIQTVLAANYYWIGNGGNWKDVNHWSLTSGGATAGVIPTINDNVFFDANSFTVPGQVVMIVDDTTTVGVEFATMDWRSVTNMPTFQIRVTISDWISNNVSGSIYFDDDMIIDFDATEFYMVSNSNYELDTRGHYMGFNCWIAFNPTWVGGFGANVTCTLLSDINHAWIYVTQGTLDANGNTIHSQTDGTPYTDVWLVGNPNPSTLDISNTNIEVGRIDIQNASTIIDNNATITVKRQINAASKNFNHIRILDSVSVVGSNNTFDSLELFSGSHLVLNSSQTVNNFVANGGEPIGLTGGTLSKSSGVVNVYGMNITNNIATGGAVFNAYASTKTGTVTGWNFYSVIPSDSLALAAIYNSTNGSGWLTRTNWLVGKVVNWHGVTASGGRVTMLDLNGNNLVGTLSDKIGDLTALEDFQICCNQITGPVPPSIGNLVNLTYMDLSPNQFTGTIPVEIGNLVNLQTLWMNNNNLVGNVPTEFTNLTQLTSLYLHANELTYLPDLSSLPLTTLHVQDNNFNFEHLEPYVGIPDFLFAPQTQNIGVFAQTLVEVGGDHTVTAFGGGTSGQYQWKRNGVSIPGADQKDFEIVAINRSNMGDYTTDITNPLFPGITLTTAPNQVLATADIAGTLYENNNLPATDGTMRLLKVTSTGSYDTTRVQAVSNSGAYLFDNVVLDDYLVNGFADTMVYQKALPTYYEKTIFWEEADTLVVEDNIAALDIFSEFKPDPPTAGQGEITGTFYETVPEGRTSAKARVSKAAVTVRRAADGGRGKDTFTELVAYIFTDENGEFTFTKLDEGEYRLNIQLPGYPMDTNSFVTIPIVNTLFDRQVGVEAEVIEGKIEVKKLVITGWQEESHIFTAYPNPTVDHLFIKGKGSDRNIKFQLTDATGRIVKVPFVWDDVNHQWKLNIQGLQRGNYFLQVHKNGKEETAQIVIQ